MNTANELDFSIHYPNFPEFARNGIDLSLSAAETILVLQALRTRGGFPIWPGPQQANWGRAYGRKTSEHFALGRNATAGDVFPARGSALKFWTLAQTFPQIGGLGLYLDTDGLDGKPWIMVHYDLRASPRRHWIRNEWGAYIHRHDEPKEFWQLFKRTINKDHA